MDKYKELSQGMDKIVYLWVETILESGDAIKRLTNDLKREELEWDADQVHHLGVIITQLTYSISQCKPISHLLDKNSSDIIEATDIFLKKVEPDGSRDAQILLDVLREIKNKIDTEN